jgi:hypothetical protein
MYLCYDSLSSVGSMQSLQRNWTTLLLKYCVSEVIHVAPATIFMKIESKEKEYNLDHVQYIAFFSYDF